MPDVTKLDTNCFWKMQNMTNSGNMTSRVAEVTRAHMGPESLALAKRTSPMVRGRFSGELITIMGQRKLFQWVLMEQIAKEM